MPITKKQELSEEEQEKKDLEEMHKNLEEYKRLKAENAQKLIERGQLLEQLNSKTTELKEKTQTMENTAKKVERVEESKNHHLLSIILAIVGFGIGVLVGFLLGYSTPMMLVVGALAGSVCYSLSTLATKLMEKVTHLKEWMGGFSLRRRGFSPQQEFKTPTKDAEQQLDDYLTSQLPVLNFKHKNPSQKEEVQAQVVDTVRAKKGLRVS